MRSARNWRTKAAEGLQTTDVLLRLWTVLAGVHRQQQPKSLSKDLESLGASLGDALENGLDSDFIRTSFSVGAKILDAAEKATYMNYAYGIGLLEECQAEISGVEGRPELNDDQQHYLDFVKFTVEGLRHILLAGQATLQREHLVASSEWKRAADVALMVATNHPEQAENFLDMNGQWLYEGRSRVGLAEQLVADEKFEEAIVAFQESQQLLSKYSQQSAAASKVPVRSREIALVLGLQVIPAYISHARRMMAIKRERDKAVSQIEQFIRSEHPSGSMVLNSTISPTISPEMNQTLDQQLEIATRLQMKLVVDTIRGSVTGEDLEGLEADVTKAQTATGSDLLTRLRGFIGKVRSVVDDSSDLGKRILPLIIMLGRLASQAA
jgi:hypothetical protein